MKPEYLRRKINMNIEKKHSDNIYKSSGKFPKFLTYSCLCVLHSKVNKLKFGGTK